MNALFIREKFQFVEFTEINEYELLLLTTTIAFSGMYTHALLTFSDEDKNKFFII